VVQFGGDNAAGLEHFDTAVSIARATGNTLRIVVNLADSAMVAGYMGDVDRARRHIEEAKSVLGDRGAAVLWSWIYYAEGEALADQDPEAALGALETALDLAGRVGSEFVIGVAGLTRTGLQLRSGDPLDAVPGLIDLVEHWRRGGAWVQQWITQRTVLDLFVALGDFHHAALVLGAVLDDRSATGVAGRDAERLDDARALLRTELPRADETFGLGASMAHDDVIDTVLARLRTHAR
jgi:tetratricopeptide (TPR) repeat protein